MKKYVEKDRFLHAKRWFKMGDVEGCKSFRDHFPCYRCNKNERCDYCGDYVDDHGIMDDGSHSERVCPGDWIVQCKYSGFFVISHDNFMRDYEEVI